LHTGRAPSSVRPCAEAESPPGARRASGSGGAAPAAPPPPPPPPPLSAGAAGAAPSPAATRSTISLTTTSACTSASTPASGSAHPPTLSSSPPPPPSCAPARPSIATSSPPGALPPGAASAADASVSPRLSGGVCVGWALCARENLPTLAAYSRRAVQASSPRFQGEIGAAAAVKDRPRRAAQARPPRVRGGGEGGGGWGHLSGAPPSTSSSAGKISCRLSACGMIRVRSAALLAPPAPTRSAQADAPRIRAAHAMRWGSWRKEENLHLRCGAGLLGDLAGRWKGVWMARRVAGRRPHGTDRTLPPLPPV